MKPIIAIVSLLLVAYATATDFPVALSQNTVSGTVFTASGSNAAGQAPSTPFDIEKATYHTFQYVTTCTNETALTLFRSLDGVSWVSFLTNVVEATSTNDTSMVGKWKYVAATFYGTNATVSVTYLGQ